MPQESPQAPRVLGRYAIFDAIASGGMATVHYGRLRGPVGFSRTVAIKRLHPQYAQDPQFVAMFLDEARLAARIRHPNVVGTLDVVATSNEIFLVMDYVHGESLSRIIKEVTRRQETVPLPIALRIASDGLQGLHAAHEAMDEQGLPLNIVHRDVSPQNILLGIDGVARLVDFGVAKAKGQGTTTREGHVKGKLGYMSPEQLRGLRVTRQTDVHAFAIVLWELLTGRRLFHGTTEADTIAELVRHEVVPASTLVNGLNPEIDGVIRRGLAEKLEDRFATARDMCVALEACGQIATSIEVADWVERSVHELLAQRAEAVSAIEAGDRDLSPSSKDPASSPEPRPPSVVSAAKTWTAENLPGRAVFEAPTTERVIPGPTADAPTAEAEGSVPAVIAVSETTNPLRWYATLGVAAGLVGFVLAVVAWTGKGRPLPTASAPPPPTATVPLPSIPPLPLPTSVTALPTPAPPVPSDTWGERGLPALPTARPASAAHAVRPSGKHASPKSSIYDTRE